MTRFMNTKAWKEQLTGAAMIASGIAIWFLILTPLWPYFVWLWERAGDFAGWVWP